MKKLTKSSLEELAQVMPVLSEKEQSSYVAGDRVEVDMVRQGFANGSTLSMYVASAYDDKGNLLYSESGYMLEPLYREDLADVKDSGCAIPEGTYDVQPSTYNGKSGYYEVTGVPGRTGIKIHKGNEGGDSKGCLMPGASYQYSDEKGYTVSDSKTQLESLFSMFNKHGDEGISLTIRSKDPDEDKDKK